MTNLAEIACRVLDRPLLIHPSKAAIITEVLAGRIGIGPIAFDSVAPEASRFTGAARKDNVYRVTPAGTAIIPAIGSSVNRGAFLNSSSGLFSYEGLSAQLSAAAADASIKRILIDIESPGGEASGAFEIAAHVRKISGTKPVFAIANSMACSAAYALASAAKTIFATPSALVGSIGVVLMHADYSRAIDKAGITPTLIHAGAHKVDGNPYEPLSKDVRGDLQAEVDRFYSLFLEAVAAGRGNRLSESAAKATEARTFIGQAAKDAGLIDQIATFDEALAAIERGASPSTSTQGNSKVSDFELSIARNSGAIAERERIKSILSLPEAASNMARAIGIATGTSLTPTEAAIALRTGGGPSSSSPNQAGVVSWDSIADQLNAQAGFGGRRK